MGGIIIYDKANQWRYGGSYETQLSFEVMEGTEYYIILVTGDIWNRDTTTFNSEYVQEVDNSTVQTTDILETQSTHPYLNGLDKRWVYNAPSGTAYNEITFANNCSILYGDYLYVYDENETLVAEYDTGYAFRGKTLLIPGERFIIRLVSNKTENAYGFALSNIVSHSDAPAPKASIESGIIRPSSVSLTSNSVATVYYKISTKDNQGVFSKYTSAINITESCTLQVYAKIGDYTSETVTYSYTVDTSDLSAPVFSVQSSSESSITLLITATEGDIYYKKMAESSYFSKLSSSGTITLYKTGVIAAYAQSGTLKSEVVYYSYTIDDNGDYELLAPIITEEAIMGGKRVTISVPDGFEFKNEENMQKVFLDGEDVTEIGSGAFYYCSSLTSIEIPNSVLKKIKTVGDVVKFLEKNA